MMTNYLLLAAGGAIGTVCRYLVSGLDYRWSYGVLPVGTLVVNVTGSGLIGLLWGFFDRGLISPQVRLFMFMGILGGYTTFSTFSLESFTLLRDGEYKIALLNVLLSNVVSIAAVFLGYLLSRAALNMLK
jgi:CrcB protein